MELLEEVLLLLYSLMNRLEAQGVYVSTRRWTKIRDVVQMLAYLQQTRLPVNKVSLADCAIVQHLAWSKHTQRPVIWSEYVAAVKEVLRLNSGWAVTLKRQMDTSVKLRRAAGDRLVDLWLTPEEEDELSRAVAVTLDGKDAIASVPLLLSTSLPARQMDLRHSQPVGGTFNLPPAAQAEVDHIKSLPGVRDMRLWGSPTHPRLWWLALEAPAAPSPYAKLGQIEFAVEFARSSDGTLSAPDSYRVCCMTHVFHPFFGSDGHIFGVSTAGKPFKDVVPLLLQGLNDPKPDHGLLEALTLLPSTQEACNYFSTHSTEEVEAEIARRRGSWSL
jgi:hypothetical protein